MERAIDITHVYADQLVLASELQASIMENRDYNFRKWRLPKVVSARFHTTADHSATLGSRRRFTGSITQW
jgi:hypothetical protein